MPVIYGDYTWKEKADQLTVSIPLKGVSSSKVDLIATSTSLKVNYSPYLVEIILFKSIDPTRHKAIVKDGVLNVTLKKKIEEIWGKIEIELDKEKRKEAKKESIAELENTNKELDGKRQEKRVVDERYSVREQMAIDERERSRIESLKQEEKETAEKEVYKALATLHDASTHPVEQMTKGSSEQGLKEVSKEGNALNGKKSHDIFAGIDDAELDQMLQELDIEGDDDPSPVSMSHHPKAAAQSLHQSQLQQRRMASSSESEEVKYIPPPRTTTTGSDSKVDIKFTPRVFPTPMRESKASEEEDWITKNRRHLKKNALVNGQSYGGGRDISEEDPRWLKAKADDFYRIGDCKSALNAYSEAVDLLGDILHPKHDDPSSSKIAFNDYTRCALSCYSNRSACYFKLRLSLECKLDCTVAIDAIQRIQPSSGEESLHDANWLNKMMLKLLLRRGTCLCHTGEFRLAYQNYCDVVQRLEVWVPNPAGSNGSDPEEREALIQSRYNLSFQCLKEDLAMLQQLDRADGLKKQGDALFGDNRVSEAMDFYDQALECVPIHVSCLSNLSACKLTLGNLVGCIADCTTALSLLNHDSSSTAASSSGDGSSQSQVIIGGAPSSYDGIDMMLSIIPPPGSALRRTWTIKTLLRRGMALTRFGGGTTATTSDQSFEHFNAAIRDYSQAVALDPKNESLKSDLNKLINYREGLKTTSPSLPAIED